MAMSRLGKAALCVLCATLLALPGYGRADIAKAFADTALPLATQHDAEGAAAGGDGAGVGAADAEAGEGSGGQEADDPAHGTVTNDESVDTTREGSGGQPANTLLGETNGESDETSNTLKTVPAPHADPAANAFVVTGGAYEIADDGVLVLTESEAYTVGMVGDATTSPTGIRVATGTAPSITLDSVRIDTTDQTNMPAFFIEGNGPENDGKTTLLLKGESTLNSAKGCAGVQKEDASRALVIDSAEGTGSTSGTLNVAGGYGGAGIGSGHESVDDSIAKYIAVRGGTVNAMGGFGAAGIGSALSDGAGSYASHLEVTGGEVHAQSGGRAAAIGSGYTWVEGGVSSATNIGIEGGTVTANSYVKNYSGGAAIGSGSAGTSIAAGISISGGSVKAESGFAPYSGAAIGSGSFDRTEGGSSLARGISISGGTVEATAYTYAPAIGSGYSDTSTAEGIVISGGAVTATGGTYAPAIGSGAARIESKLCASTDPQLDADGVAISDGTVIATACAGSGGSGIGSGAIVSGYTGGSTTTSDVVISGGSVTATGAPGRLADACSYTAPGIGPSEVNDTDPDDPTTATFEASIARPLSATELRANVWTGESADKAQLAAGNAESVDLTKLEGARAYTRVEFAPCSGLVLTTAGGGPVDEGAYSYDKDGDVVILNIQKDGDYVVKMAEGATEARTLVAVSGDVCGITLDNVNIASTSDHACVDLSKVRFARLSLKGSNTLSVASGKYGSAVATHPQGELFIAGIEDGASLKATGGYSHAAIGTVLSNEGVTCGDITIENAKITAIGGTYAPGIGASVSPKGSATASDITIRNSTVEAVGGAAASGIGSGWASGDNAVSDIVIEDSTVTATGGFGAPGIGSGYSDAGNSTLSGVRIANSTVVAQGGGSDSEEVEGEGDEGSPHAVGAGAGIGSGFAEAGDSTVSGISIVGGDVTATAGIDADGAGGAPGIGAGPALRGASVATGIALSGNVAAQGGATNAANVGPAMLPAVGAGSAAKRTTDGNAIAPVNGQRANAWKGSSAEDEKQFAMLSFGYDLDDFADAYLRMELAPSPAKDTLKVEEGSGAYEFAQDGALVLTESADYVISMAEGAEASTTGIRIAAGASPAVTLNGVRIDTTINSGMPAFHILKEAGTVTLKLQGESSLASAKDCAGLQKDNPKDVLVGKEELVITSIDGDGATTGSLTALGGYGGAGIGAGFAADGASRASRIVVKGGTVNATGGYGAAGIGSGYAAKSDSIAKNIFIEAGAVAAQSGAWAAGIGSGYAGAENGLSSATAIFISGGAVSANAHQKNATGGAAIGSGRAFESVAGGISISGGKVDAQGGKSGGSAPAIGSGVGDGGDQCLSLARNLSITGGTVVATAYTSAPAIGSGAAWTSLVEDLSLAGDDTVVTARGGGLSPAIGSGTADFESKLDGLTISGGTITATAGEDSGGSGIGSGSIRPNRYEASGGRTAVRNVAISGGDVEAVGAPGGRFADECSYRAAAFGPSEVNDTDPDNPTEVVFEGGSISPTTGLCFSLWSGDSFDESQLEREYAMESIALDTYAGAYQNVYFETPPDLLITTPEGGQVDPSEYEYYKKVGLDIIGSGDYVVKMAPGVTETHGWIGVGSGASPVITLDNVHITNPPTIACIHLGAAGDVTLNLKGRNVLDASTWGSGILRVNQGALSIVGIEDGASLEAKSGSNKAAIGALGPFENLTIENATITAIGGPTAPGIGGRGYINDPSTVTGITIRNSTVTAVGGEAAAGIGSGWSADTNAVSGIVIENSTVTATGGVGAPGIGSGYANTGDSTLSDVRIVNSTVVAQGGDSEVQEPQTKADDTLYGIGAGAGIGSGYADQGNSTVSGISIVGGSVTATAGTDTATAGGAPGIGAGPAYHGVSTATGIALSGNVEAWGGATNAEGFGLGTLPAVGAGSATERATVDAAIVPVNDLRANAWKGASAASARQFLTLAAEPYALGNFEDAYLRVELVAPQPVDPGSGGKAKPLVSTGDGTIPLMASVAALALLAIVGMVAAFVRLKRGRVEAERSPGMNPQGRR
ncbi:beta strand repeat-containing protein [Gordonibacter massiliensis (ex Traore et al. 2017)]|uniref:beta strand repeat-containing protein n=1 Tax=Gordonibacter massiliensis (ex Traore et al. 2017) TaxID=1841863 RepID=UPI001C8B9B3B|nr:hypothetical protein [Gordonibacter massiliensis (ex Traore et al. 2017)]MBX9032727.1 hypothetical protein [Gordonibacter massiliensis (ex Traore et al. 2017)]